MKIIYHNRKKIAALMLAIISINLLTPCISYALTSGPAQPEMAGFQTAGVADMVDLQTGQLKYNIPLLDIDGYPINLSYDSNTNIDDEASWVGLGWSLNPGAINRQVRGVPDDFSGDTVETDHYIKPKVTVGGRLTAKYEFKGIAGGGSFNFGIFSDNYTGIGAELGVNAGISYAFANDGGLTAGLGVGILSNTQSGIDISPYVNLSIRSKAYDGITNSAGLSASLGYNTRSGLKSQTLGLSYSAAEKVKGKDYDGGYNIDGSSISYNTEPIMPSIQVPFTSDYQSFSFDVGFAAFAGFTSLGGTGYKNVRQVKNVQNLKPAFGFLYAERGKNQPDAVMDFIREKDNPVIPELPNLALPVNLPDLWSYTSQTGSGQFRFFRGGTGAFFDNKAEDASTTSTSGGDLGAGTWAHVGITHYEQNAKTTTLKWTNSNQYLPNGDFQNPSSIHPEQQHAYFKQIGEKGIEDQDADAQLKGTQALQVATQGMSASSGFRNAGHTSGPVPYRVTSQIGKTSRRPNRTAITYLTAAEAAVGPTKTYPFYPFNDSSSYASLTSKPVASDSVKILDDSTQRTTYYRKSNHISKITVTDDGGKRMVYGIPVYNITQDEYSFAVDSTRDANKLVNTMPDLSSPSGDTYGIDHYYHKDHKPAYATGYLLTSILSPDYVDKTGNGISDDDLGTAIKFNYSKLPYYYKWRTPYTKATPNRALMADPDDDKGSIIYGEKEVWYVQSIESKTKVAYFITQDRRDALGVANWNTGGPDAGNKQKYLKEIRLYSKADMTRPIKVIKFAYNYQSCRGIPNSADAGTSDQMNGGKLTLARVWFEYQNSTKGKSHPYIFDYNQTTAKYTTAPQYAFNSTDRWGTYKPISENTNGMDNEQYPYTNQDASYTSDNAALWHLKTITLPTGGIISVNYESGDYAYVQNQRAMVMTGVQAMIKDTAGTVTTALNQAIGLKFNIGTDTIPPAHVDTTAWFKNTFLNGSNYLYTKMYVNMATNNWNHPNAIPYDMVPTYCQISSVRIKAGVARVMFVPVTESSVTVNPISISAWQRLKNEYPRYAYPGFDNRVQTDNSSVLAAVTAIVNAAKNLSELKKNFYQKANSRGYASQILLGRSFVKIAKSNGFKLGGSARVKKITISDAWQSANSSATNRAYGQQYTYTTTENGKTISSGVASNEPSIGNDESALKQPVPYIEHIKGAINNYFDLEQPFGESFFPAPSIVYSRVTVNDLDANGNPSTKTGYVVNEFYTAKDFPTKVTTLPITSYRYHPSATYSLMRSSSDDELSLSQGYSIELNDMHGKPKSVRIFNQSGAEISSTLYVYHTVDNGGTQSLDNNVPVLNASTMQLNTQVMGRDIDFFTDFREQETSNRGTAVNLGGDFFPIPPFLPFFGLPHLPTNKNDDYKLFRSVCAVKVIQNYGILSKVIKTENGSTITTENVAYDALTGEAVVTKANNEFNKNIYTVNIPAYWAYNGMGPAYQNLGVLLSNFTTNTNGEINTNYSSWLHGGDEVMDIATGTHYWVIDNTAASGSGTTKKLIARDGTLLKNLPASETVKIIRSGFRNMLTASTSTLVCLNSPFTADNHLQLISSGDLTSALKVINVSTTTFDESWGVNNQCVQSDVKINPLSASFSNTTLPNIKYLAMKIDYANSDSMHTVVLLDTSYFKTYSHVLNSYIKSDVVIGDSTVLDITIDTCINIPVSKQYNLGWANASVYVDGKGWSGGGYYDPATNYFLWNVVGNCPSGYLTAGRHKLTINAQYLFADGPNFGVEIYDNTLDELSVNDTTGANIHVIFNLLNFRGKTNIRSGYRINRGSGHISPFYYHYTKNGLPLDPCNDPLPSGNVFLGIINPYISGYLGNWRPYQTKVYQQSRNYAYSGNLNQAKINVKDAGYVNSFFPYWYFNTSTGKWTVNPNGSRWVTANTVTLYDKYGQQLENKDALGRYSAAKFDFNGELPSAVASNAMNREIYAASLEDNRFTPGGSSSSDTCNVREFIEPSTKSTLKQLAINTIAHSGNYSAKLPTDGVTLSTIIDTVTQKSTPYLALDASKQYITQTTTGLYPNGFEPYTGKQYIFNAWVNDGNPADKTVRLSLNMNGTTVPLKCKAVVEGWKLVEGTLDLSTLGSATALNISIVPNSGSVIYIDDIRMHPFDAQMKTYAYDDKTMRLMAEIDENGFATFYEYDDEGLLIRVKKETEKGIMTLKESRSTYRRNSK